MDEFGQACEGSFERREAAPTASERLILRDGTALTIRPLEANDRVGLLMLFTRLSPESRRRRFLSPKRNLSERELAFLTDIDHVSHEALVAVDRRDGAIVGVARYVQMPDCDAVADSAVVVADDLQRMGVGTALATRLVARARTNNFESLVATVLSENRPARALTRRLSFRPRSSGGSEIELELRVKPRARPCACGDRRGARNQ